VYDARMAETQKQSSAPRAVTKCVPVKLSIQTIRVLDFLAQKKGFNRTVIISLAVQRMGQEEGFK
jgi:hypothetical protein